jgi:Sodium:neurotransmitter symporter family
MVKLLRTILMKSERVLGITDGIENLSSVRWELFGTLILAWILVYFIIWKGLNESGYVSFKLNPMSNRYVGP